MPTSPSSLPGPEGALPESRGEPELLETSGALNVRHRGRLLYPERGPALFPERVALATEVGEARLHLVNSPLLWYGAETLRGRLGPSSAILFLEADPRLAALSRERLPPWLGRDGRSAFLCCADEEAVLAAARELGSFRLCVSTDLSGGASLDSARYRRIAARLQSELSAAWRNRASLMAMGRLWTRNIFRNLASLPEIGPRPLPRLGKPTFVLGAGPSLEGVLPLIAGHRDRLALVACDTALPPLAALGIVPDLAICLEGQAHNLHDFAASGGAVMPLLADLSSHPASFRALAGPKHLSLVSIAPGAFGRRLAALDLPFLPAPPLGSVGVHALHVARRISEGPILAVGLDFAYEGGKTHARGAPAIMAENWRMTRRERWPRQAAIPYRRGVRPVEGGGRLLTDPILATYAALLAEDAACPGPQVYDLRGRGLPLGLPQLSLEKAAALLAAPPRERPSAGSGQARDGRAEESSAAALSALARAFLEGELERVGRLRAALKGRASLAPSALLALLAEIDWITWTFPDAERLAALPQDLLNRLLVETEYWSWQLGECLGILAGLEAG
jgi:hypothetical protein